jgi:hypothetical protein
MDIAIRRIRKALSFADEHLESSDLNALPSVCSAATHLAR